MEHICLNAGKYGFRGRNPLDIISSNGMSFKDSLKQSFSSYLDRLDRGYNNYPASEEEHAKFLTLVMEKPFHAMRVALQYKLGTVAPRGEGEFSDTKGYLIGLYSEHFDPGLLEPIRAIQETAREYVLLLKARKKGKLAAGEIEVEYRRMLDRLMECYPHTYYFIEQNALMMGE